MQPLVDFSTNHPALAGVAALLSSWCCSVCASPINTSARWCFFSGATRTSGPGLYPPAPLLERRTPVDLRANTTSVEQLRGIIGQHSLDDVLKARDTISEALQATIDKLTEPWGVKVECARQIKAEAELDAAGLLKQAAHIIMESPAGLELRHMQMNTEVGAEQNTMTIIMMPSEFVEIARTIGARGGEKEKT
jgi:hypothetical protein